LLSKLNHGTIFVFLEQFREYSNYNVVFAVDDCDCSAGCFGGKGEELLDCCAGRGRNRPEIIREGLKVLKAVEEVSGVTFSTTYYPYGAEHYLATGEVLPDSALRELEQNNAIFFGAAGDPRVPPGILEIELILKIRFLLDQYINLRPIHLFPNVVSPLRNDKGIDFYIIRENTEDFYNGMGHRFDVRNDNSLRQQCALEMKRKRYRAQVSIDSQLDIKEDYAITLGLMTRGGAERVSGIPLIWRGEKAKPRSPRWIRRT
jgi:isocitrate/isopropylmalate dehydrogenase